MTRPFQASLALVLLPVLLAGSGCAPPGSMESSAFVERMADGDYDVGIRYPSKRTRYVLIVDENENEEALALTNRPAVAGQDAGAAPESVAEPTAPQRNDRVLAPCGEATGSWYRHTPAGYVCAGGTAASGSGG